MKSMKINSPLSQIHQRKKLQIKRKSAGIAKYEIKNITGHASEKGLDAYDSWNEECDVTHDFR